MSVLENTKKSRNVVRGSFTHVVNEFNTIFCMEKPDMEAFEVAWELITGKYDSLMVLDSEIYNLLLESSSEKELEIEINGRDEFTKQFTMAKLKYKKLMEDAVTNNSSSNTTNSGGDTGMRKFKLPRLEFKHYDGSIRDWLPFWAQFKKVHEDTSIDSSDKIEYLIQATVPGSKARQLVESYPAMSENYSKIIESMQNRFGREDLQIEVYVRELLKLILSNSGCEHKIDMADLYDRIESQLRALDTLGITSDKCSAMLFPLIESCLPYDLLRAWQRSTIFNSTTGSEEDVSVSPLENRLKKLMLFLKSEVENEQRIALAEEGFGLSEGISGIQLRSRKPVNCPTATGLINQDINKSCTFCLGCHESQACFKARKMNLDEKKDALSKNKACFRCLKAGHITKRCKVRLSLSTRKHETKKENCSEPRKNDKVLGNYSGDQVFLQTLQVTLRGINGNRVVRALLDCGSQRTYILTDTTVNLGCKSKRFEKILHGLFGGTEVANEHQCFDITMCKDNFSFTFEALDQEKICSNLAPIWSGPWLEETKALGIDISDINGSGPIELLLGADVLGRFYTGGYRKLQCGLIAMETLVGWTLMGKLPNSNRPSNIAMCSLSLFIQDANISDLWDLEAIGIKEPCDKNTKEDSAAAALELFLETIGKNNEGRYEVKLPWLEGHPPFPSNFELAQKRLGSTLHKLSKGNDNLKAKYNEIFLEWEQEGIIERVESSNPSRQVHYLPHRPVIKESSATTKIRPVFDASAHLKNTPSMNACLEKGINLIELIPTMLFKFRLDRIGIVADIRKAFLQISINEKDRDFLRFLWVDSQGEQIIYRHRRVVFGLICSPFLLGATLDYHFDQCIKRCREIDCQYTQDTVNKLKTSFYVDNCVTSLPDEEAASNFIQESITLMSEGCFDLRGWERTQLESCADNVSIQACPVLGLNWCSTTDYLSLNPIFLGADFDHETTKITKRVILSISQKVFDPIGYVCPATLLPKLILQKLWANNLSWDQTVDVESGKAFKAWVKELPYLFYIKIPRWIKVKGVNWQNLSLHTFCDASQAAYACVIFLRVVTTKGVSVFLLAAKARVAPVKKSSSKMTIPRLELLAATIAARLYAHISDNLDKNIDCYFWSDSTTVISWIQNQEEWSVFVWNRVKEIRALTPCEKWRHIPTAYNPADLPSRSCSPKQLVDSKWWEGPEWLYGDTETWPISDMALNEEEIKVERKKKLVSSLMNLGDKDDFWHLYYFGKYSKTLRMIGWVGRFVKNCRVSEPRKKGELTTQELENAELFVFKLIQEDSFSGPDDGNIKSLSPFKDDKGLIRMKSRVSRRPDSEDFCYPILLPSKHKLVSNLIMYTHIKSCHVGTQGLLCILRERFWILGGRRAVKSVITRCVVCRRFDAKPLKMEPPPLPLDRVRDAIAFEVTGVDLAGPLYLQNGDKVWICLFTCAVYRAVHLELTTSLSTSNFLQALRRFVSRRGRPKTIYSDNGSNFVGAENAISSLDWDSITHETSVQRIRWCFNPPSAPWWGGFWERLIGILKRLLRSTLGRARLNYEELLTLICECEAVVNARPLTYLSEDANDLTVLTPSMFLREQSECGVPDCDDVDRVSLCRKVRQIQCLRDDLRVRFRNEYLGQLKLLCGKKSNREVVVGETVLVGNDNDKRINWPIARVIRLLPGRDGKVRLVELQTARGTLMRPIQRLYPLECVYVLPQEDEPRNSTIPEDDLEQEQEALSDDNGEDLRKYNICDKDTLPPCEEIEMQNTVSLAPLGVNDVVNLLQHHYALISGGKSNEGCPIITFPDINNFQMLSDVEYQRLMLYLTSVPTLQEADMGFHLVIDRRKDRWNSVKTVLLKISVFFPGLIQVVYVLRPASFLQKALSEVSNKFYKDEFKFRMIVLSTAEELHEYINPNQLTVDLDGSLAYNHQEWINQRIELENFSFVTQQVSNDLDEFTKLVDETELPNNVDLTQKLLITQNESYLELKKSILLAAKIGEALLRTTKDKNTSKNDSAVPDMMGNVLAVERLLVQLEETEKTFDEFWQQHSTKLCHCLELRRFEQDFKELQVNLDSNLKTVSDMTELGESVSRVDVLIHETNAFEEICQTNIQRADEAVSSGHMLMGVNSSCPIECIEPKCSELLRMKEMLLTRLSKRKDMLVKSRELMERVEKANDWCTSGIALLASQTTEQCSNLPDLAEKYVTEIQNFETTAKEFLSNGQKDFKDAFHDTITPETKALVLQVLQRTDDIILMCDKRVSSLNKIAVKNKRPIQAVIPEPAVPRQPLVGAPQPTKASLKKSYTTSKMESTMGVDEEISQNESHISSENDEVNRIKTGHVLSELLDSERVYVNELLSIIKGYKQEAHLDDPQLLPANASEKFGVIFGNLDEIYNFHSQYFLKDLENCISSADLVALCFVQKREHFLRLYSFYCQNISKSEQLRESSSELIPFFIACQKNLGHKLPLAAYLLKPVQRITKYQLLLSHLLRYSEGRKCCKELQQALDCMLIVLKCVNDSMHQISITGFPGDLSQQGELLLQGFFSVCVENKKDLRLRLKPMSRHLFLYQKSLVFCKPVSKAERNKATYQFKHQLQMSQIGLTETVRGDSRRFEVWLQGRQEVHIIQAANLDQKNAWVNEIKKVLYSQLEEIKGEKIKQYAAVMHRPLRQTTSWETQKSTTLLGEVQQRAMSCDNEPQNNLADDSMECTEAGSWSSDASNSDDEEHTISRGRYVALADYCAIGNSEVNMREGDIVELLKVGCAGWWFVKVVGSSVEGWAPAAYLDSLSRKALKGSSRSQDTFNGH